MSILGAVTLGVTRDSLPKGETVKKSDLGKGTAQKGEGEKASVRDIVSTLIPTGFVAPYTAAITGVAGIVKKPTPDVPNPELYVGWRIGIYAALIILTITFLLAGYYRQRAKKRRFPVLEAFGTLIAAAAWGIATPESFVYAVLDEPMRGLIPTLIGGAGAGLLFALGFPLKKAPN